MYVNNNNTTGDEWCIDVGDDITGDGSASAPYATVAHALSTHTLDSTYEIRIDSGVYNNESDLLSGNTDDSYFTIRGVYRNGVPVSVFDFEGDSSKTLLFLCFLSCLEIILTPSGGLKGWSQSFFILSVNPSWLYDIF